MGNNQTPDPSVGIPTTYQVGYGYDKVSNRTELHYPDGKNVMSFYDAADRLDIINQGGVNFVDYNYDPLDRAIQKSYLAPTLPLTMYSYDIANQLTNVSNSVIGGGLVSHYE